MDKAEIVARLNALTGSRGNCMCGMFESCEYCNHYSAYSKQIEKIHDLVYEIEHGQARPPLTAKDYGASISFTMDEIRIKKIRP